MNKMKKVILRIFEWHGREAMRTTFALSAFFLSFLAAGQGRVILKAGGSVRDIFKISDIYHSPVFTTSDVQFKSGMNGRSKMNYNRLSDEMEFLKGRDTLELVDKELLKQIKLADSVFYFDPLYGYLLELNHSKQARLLKKDYIRFVDTETEVGYGVKSSASSTTSYSSLFSNASSGSGAMMGGRALNLIAKQDIIYKRGTDYYFGNEKGQFAHADKKSILKLFPGKKSVLSKYFKESDVDFKDPAALRQLFTLISEGQ
jgi:hypothetical protein